MASETKLQERRAYQEARYADILKMGRDSGMRVSLQWLDCERVVHSWEAVAALMQRDTSTVRVYRSRKQLSGKPFLLMHPNYPHSLSDCVIEVTHEARRGPPIADPAKKQELDAAQISRRQRKSALKRLELEARISKLEISLNLAKAQLEQLQ